MDDILQNSYFKNNKQNKYSFPKSNRFPHLKSNYTIDYFQTSSVHSRRSASFGYGTKYDVFKEKQRSPGPFQYAPHQQLNNTKNISFGVGRDVKKSIIEKVKSNSYIDASKIKTPRAGQYEVRDLQFKKKAPTCVMISRKPGDSFIKPDHNPDPGCYHPIDTFYSRRKRSSQFGFGSSRRFELDKSKGKNVVGPGSYNLPDEARKSNAFSHAKRKTYAVEQLQKSISPGPKYFVR